MATFKALIRPDHKRADGMYKVYIRLTHQRKQRYLATPFYVSTDQLTRGMKIKDRSVLDKVEEKIGEYRRIADDLGFLQEQMDTDALVHALQAPKSDYDFLAFMQDYLDRMSKDGRKQTADAYRTALNSLREYNRNTPLPFASITKQYMLGYWESIKNLKANTRRSYITNIKAAYRRAQKQLNDDEAGIIIARHGVFDLIDLPPMESRNELAFEKVEDMQAVIDAPYTGCWSYDLAKDLFVLSFVLLGMNYADLIRLRKSDYRDGVITYSRKKVKERMGNRSEMKIQVPEVGKIILEKYSGDKVYLIDFAGHPRSSDVPRRIHATFQNAGLEPMGETYLERAGHVKGRYVFYSARHSMATFARNECGIDKLTVHEMLNHATPREYQMTDVYLRRDYSHLWAANEKLLALFDWGFYLSQKKCTGYSHEPPVLE